MTTYPVEEKCLDSVGFVVQEHVYTKREMEKLLRSIIDYIKADATTGIEVLSPTVLHLLRPEHEIKSGRFWRIEWHFETPLLCAYFIATINAQVGRLTPIAK